MYTKKQIEEAWKIAEKFKVGSLGAVGSNAKTIKGDKKGEYLTWIMYLAPSDQSGAKQNTCPKASDGCRTACLFTAGRGATSPVRQARINRTNLFFQERDAFKVCLFDEITKHVKYCKKQKITPAVRINGTSDLCVPRLFKDMLNYYEDVKWYDYTKCIGYLDLLKDFPQYHLTFSKNEANDKDVQKVIKDYPDVNIAVVFKKELPQKWLGRDVINADEDDLRFADPQSVICGLKAKGKARYDTSGFVVDPSKITLPVLGLSNVKIKI